MAHQYSRVGSLLSVEVNLSLYYCGVGRNFNFHFTALDTQDAATGLITTSTLTFTFESTQNSQNLACTADVGMACEVSESVILLGKSF